jgi:predicted nucleotidyltransferase
MRGYRLPAAKEMLKESYKTLQQELLQAIKAFYGEGLVSFALFGSVGRGTQRFDSDLDFLLICESLPSGRMKRVEQFQKVEDAVRPCLRNLNMDGYLIDLSPVIKTKEEAMRGSPVFLDMVEDAIILYDKEGFFEGVLERLRKKLATLGAKRVWRGSAWYWDLKPDFRPGEVFEL